MSVLDGMTRAEALKRVIDGVFCTEHNSYVCPSKIGLDVNHCMRPISGDHHQCWISAINAHFDDLEAKAKWVEPKVGILSGNGDVFYKGIDNFVDFKAEIARTNARREIEGFVAANPSGGRWEIWYDDGDNKFYTQELRDDRKWPGLIVYGSEEQAHEVIRRFSPELRLLAGVGE